MFRSLLVLTVLASAAAALLVWWRLRNGRAAVRILAAVGSGLATAGVIWVSTIGLFLAALFEVWPLSLRQGPDTTFSRTCYEEFLGVASPDGVSDIYCRREWGFGGDDINTLRFTFDDRAIVQAIVGRMQLQEVPAADREHGRYLEGPKWWPPRAQLWQVREVYQRAGREFLWVDFDRMEAFYQHASF